MLRLTCANSSSSFVAAASMAATALLVLAGTAHAEPLQAPCREFKFGAGYELMESTGWRVAFSPGAAGREEYFKVSAYDPNGAVGNSGRVANPNLNGRKLYLDVNWKNGWGTEYSGEVNDDGMVVNGTKRDWIRYEEHFHTWNSTIPVVCELPPGAKLDDELIDPVQVPR